VQQRAGTGCLSGSNLDEMAGEAGRDSLRNMEECFMAERKQSSSSATSHRGGSGNFAEDREKASEAGRKGGEHSGGSRSASAGGGQSEHRGGSGNFAEDRERASEAGRKGGQSRGDR